MVKIRIILGNIKMVIRFKPIKKVVEMKNFKRRNYVAKYAPTFNKTKVFRDRTKYDRKNKEDWLDEE